MKTISLMPETTANITAQSAASSGDKNSEMQVDEPPVPQASGTPAESTEGLIHYLIGELMRTVKTDMSPENASATASIEAPKPAPTDAPAPEEKRSDAPLPSSESKAPQDPVDYTYPCFIMQVLTELLFSYESCKIAFLSFTPKKRNQTPAKEGGVKHRTAAIQFLLSDLMTFGTINPQPPSEARKQITLCNWAMSVIVALCVDTITNHEIKDVPTDLVSVRKFVLEAISRALKDLPSSDSPEVRYSRLLALSDLPSLVGREVQREWQEGRRRGPDPHRQSHAREKLCCGPHGRLFRGRPRLPQYLLRRFLCLAPSRVPVWCL